MKKIDRKPYCSIIIPCKNRLDHIKQTLPFNSSFEDCEVIIVDYGCEQGTENWVHQNFPSVTVVKVTDDPVFNLSRARNIGARNAKADILCFVDADLTVLIDLSDWIFRNFQRGNFYTISERGIGTGGFVICHRGDFNEVGGYDEAIRGWAPEDQDFYERLEFAGVNRQRAIPNQSFRPIEHSHDMRAFGQEHGGYENKMDAFSLGLFFLMVKRDIRHITRCEPEFEFRRQLFEEIIRLNQIAIEEKVGSFELVVDLGGRALLPTRKEFSTTLIYRYDQKLH